MLNRLKEHLGLLGNIVVSGNRDQLRVGNLTHSFTLTIDPAKLRSVSLTRTPFGEPGVQVSTKNGHVLITDHDFVFEVQQHGSMIVNDLIGICSAREAARGVENYVSGRYASTNIDTNLAQYMWNRAILESARRAGINVDELIGTLNVCFLNAEYPGFIY